MNRIKKSSLLTIIVFGIIWGFTSSFQQTNVLIKEQVIERAEQFVIDNGYTNLLANKTKLNYELFDKTNKDSAIAR